MDLPRRKPLNENETLDPAEDKKTFPAQWDAPPLTWDEAVRECKVELERARRLVEYLETMTARFEQEAHSKTGHSPAGSEEE